MFEEHYSLADRLLHRLALGVPALAELTFDLDQKACQAPARAEEAARGKHVFVTGLARAGTTVLMRAIYQTGTFRSLTYRDMPFPLAPNLAKQLLSRWRREGEVRERAHGDRVLTDLDSPEALEQVFWRIHTGKDYIRRDGLLAYRPSDEAMGRFQAYVAAILASGEAGQVRYLSKNNNNILRLPALLDAFPNAVFLLPFRDPASQATSLWRQHLRFCDLQRERPFVRSYMDWLVHHEFGLGHRPFRIGTALPSTLTPEDLDYWLEIWIRVHEALLADSHPHRHFVCYETLCSNPRAWTDLATRLCLPDGAEVPVFTASTKRPRRFDPQRLAHAESLYGVMQELSAPGSCAIPGLARQAPALAP